jgi:hypothetical protein
MKLYTEEEIKRTFGFGMNKMHFDGFMNAMKPIEIPSDEEIENISYTNNPYPIQKQMHIDWANGFERGAKWIIEQLKNQQ